MHVNVNWACALANLESTKGILGYKLKNNYEGFSWELIFRIASKALTAQKEKVRGLLQESPKKKFQVNFTKVLGDIRGSLKFTDLKNKYYLSEEQCQQSAAKVFGIVEESFFKFPSDRCKV